MNNLTRQILSVLLIFCLSTMPALAVTDEQKPLKDKENPLLIGQRNINKGQVNFYSLEKERALGRQMAMEVDRNAEFVDDPVITEYVNRLGQNLVINSDARVPFTIKVIDASEINAFALPGGFLYINRGLIEAARDEAELAGVIAHEIAHVAARHGVEQASKGQLLNWASLPLIFLGGWGGFIINQAAGIALPLTFLKFSRGAEKEADRLAAQYLWKAGYDPVALITFFEKLQAQEKKKAGTLEKIFRSHPMNKDRIKEVHKLLARFPDKNAYQFNSSDFVASQKRLRRYSIDQRLLSAPEDNRRPTLKRRRPVADTETNAPTKERPTLKRRTPDAR
jgi:beta-barrel assembly-enhancing protease